VPIRCLHRAGSRSCAGTLPPPCLDLGTPSTTPIHRFQLPCKLSTKHQASSIRRSKDGTLWIDRTTRLDRQVAAFLARSTNGPFLPRSVSLSRVIPDGRDLSPSLSLSLSSTLGTKRRMGSVASRWPVCRVGGRRPSARARLRPASSVRARTSCASGHQAGSASGRGRR
jgi:hypothetical protein